jgi:hypothetical protein
MARRLFLTPDMSNPIFSHSLNQTHNDQEEMVIVTSKQYLAVADDFLRRLFPEIHSDMLDDPGPFTVFITDDECVLH